MVALAFLGGSIVVLCLVDLPACHLSYPRPGGITGSSLYPSLEDKEGVGGTKRTESNN